MPLSNLIFKCTEQITSLFSKTAFIRGKHLKNEYQSLCIYHHGNWIHEQRGILKHKVSSPTTRQTNSITLSSERSPALIRIILGRWILDRWKLSAGTISPHNCHLPPIIIHNYRWYSPPCTGITQPESNIHLINDREWDTRPDRGGRLNLLFFWATVRHLRGCLLLHSLCPGPARRNRPIQGQVFACLDFGWILNNKALLDCHCAK